MISVSTIRRRNGELVAAQGNVFTVTINALRVAQV